MSQLPEQLLKSSSIPMMGPMGQNINLINQVPLPQPIQAQPNMVPNQNLGMAMPVQDAKSQPNQDSN